MDELSSTSTDLNAAHANIERDYEAQVSQMDESERKIMDRLDKLNKKKHEIAQKYGNIDAAGDDIVEINAGGKIIAAKRATLTQLEGTRLELLLSGRWEKKLQRDNNGRIFLDVNPKCFQAIVDYLHELAISSEDNPPHPPSVDDERTYFLQHQLYLFGLSDRKPGLIDSCIIKDATQATQLTDWLKEDGSDGELNILYRTSRDGRDNSTFHAKCDNKGCTLTVIETTCGRILGGYSNTPWTYSFNYMSSGVYAHANKAFLFSLCDDSPCKMKLKNENDDKAVYHCSSYGPTFANGHDICVEDEGVTTRFGCSYESCTSPELKSGINYTIKEVEVFQVITGGSSAVLSIASVKKQQTQQNIEPVTKITQFSVGINKAINVRLACLLRAELELAHLENSFKDEQFFIDKFSGGDDEDVITLNVSGTFMMTKRATLCTAEDSVLAQQFDDSKWTEQGYNTPRVKEWTPDEVYAWARKIDDISDEVAIIFVENDITGNELLALDKDGLIDLGITRTGTRCLLLKEIKKLEKASQDVSTLIEHGPYCFGKILDHLRLKQLHSMGLIGEEPALPKVFDSQKDRFEKVVKYYFPGDSSNFILG